MKVLLKDSMVLLNSIFEHLQHVPNKFTVKHFAGGVTYTIITKFVEKNKDTVVPDLLTACQSSTHEILRECFIDDVSGWGIIIINLRFFLFLG